MFEDSSLLSLSSENTRLLNSDCEPIRSQKKSQCKCSSSLDKLDVFFQLAERSQDAILITDEKRRIIYVNKTFEDRSGYLLSDIKGTNPRRFKSEKNPKGVYRELMRSLNSSGEWQGPLIQKHKDGSDYIENVKITTLCDKYGRVKYYLGQKALLAEQSLAQDQVFQLTQYDALTELPNRRFLINTATQLYQSSIISHTPFGILFIDMDDFKSINDSYGHAAGDYTLQQLALRLISCREGNDVIARVGGDEFCILHYNATTESMRTLVQKLIAVSREPLNFKEHTIPIGVSVGGAIWPNDASTLKELLICADLAMYQAKSTGSDYIAYTFDLSRRYNRERDILQALRLGLEENKFYLVYQPKYHLIDKSITGTEALLRLESDKLGAIFPGEFIPIAERNYLMRAIGLYVFERVNKQLTEWRSAGLSLPGRLSINISAQQLEDPELAESFSTILKRHDLSATLFELEITESMLMKKPEQAIGTLEKLRNLGFSIAIDDFGTGFSSLSYLSRINASCLKIDKSFISELIDSQSNELIVHSIIRLADSLGMTVISEGIETDDQLKRLVKMGCVSGQGYLLDRPLNVDNMTDRIKASGSGSQLLRS